jgi:hypothetical protein
MAEKTYANTTKRRRVWFARITVPKDVRNIIGKNILIASTGQTNPAKGHAIAAPMLAEWRARIEAARRTASDPIGAEIDRLATLYREGKGADMDEAANLLVSDVLAFTFQKLGGVSRIEQRQALLNSGGDVKEALKSLPASATAIAALDRITGTATPFLAHVHRWKGATHLKGQTLDHAIVHIKDFVATVEEPIETLTGRHVQAWIEKQLSAGKKPNTVNNHLSSMRSYWEWMQSHDLAPESSRPFWNRKITNRKSEVEQ